MKRRRGRPLGVIGVRAAKANPGRERFTIAHEIGHYVLGRNDFLISRCTRRDIGMHVRERPEREIAANRFAAELLLPTEIIYEAIREQSFSISAARLVADRFRVSLTAAALQCAVVTDQSCAVVVTIDGTVRFFRPSKSWTSFIQVDCALGKGSIAARLDLAQKEATDVVNICAWVSGGRIDSRDVVLENSIYLPAHNMILTVLTDLNN
jgi:hypothetical protein